MLIYRRYCMHTLKKILAGFLAVMMTVSVFSVSAAEALADDTYEFGVFYGFGRTAGTQKLSGIDPNGVTNTGYSIEGNTSGYDNSTGTQYSQSGVWSDIDSLDFYYGSESIHISLAHNSWVYLDSDGKLQTTVSTATPALGTNLVKIAKSSSNYFNRWYYVGADLFEVIHYKNGHHININTGDENAEFTSTDIPDYFYEKTANTGVIEIGGSTYSSTAGISTTVAPDAAPSKILITVGAGDAVTINDAAADVYLTSGNAISDTHSSTDILRYNAGEYTFYNVSADINIAYAYSAAEYTVTFMAGENEYDSKVVAGGTPVVAPTTDPEKDGYAFAGWYEKDGDVYADSSFDFSTPINSNITLYAKFEIAHTLTINNIKSISSTQWAGTTGGKVGSVANRSAQLTTVGDYMESADYTPSSPGGVQVSAGVLGTLKSITFEWGNNVFTAEGEDVFGQQYIYADGSHRHEPSGVTSDEPFIFKYAFNDGQSAFYLRFRELTQNITITVEYENHTVFVEGASSISASQWEGNSGGTHNVLGRLTTMGDYINCSSSTGGTLVQINASFGTPDKLTVVVNGNETVFDRSEDSEKYLNTSGEKVDSFSANNTILKYALSSNKMYIRLYIVSSDITIRVGYEDEPDTVSMKYIDNDSATYTFSIDMKTINTSVSESGYEATVPTGELGKDAFALKDDRSVRFVVEVSTLVKGLKLSTASGEVLKEFITEDGIREYVSDDHTYKFAYSSGTDGYKKFFLRIGHVTENIVISPILNTVTEDSSISMAVEVGNTLTAKFFAELTDGMKAAGYDSYIFRAQLGSNGEVDLPGTVAESGTVTFSLEQIYAQCMSEKITGTLYGVKDGAETRLDGIETGISVAEYCDKVAAAYSSNENLLTFMANMLNYGSECQKFVNYDAENLAITGHDWADTRIGSEAPVSPVAADELSVTADGYDKALGRIKAAGLNISNKIAVYFNVYLPDGADNFALTVDETPYDLTPGADGMCRIQLDRITPSAYDKIYTAELSYKGEVVQTVRYSVNTYCERKIGTASVGDLCKAIYNYGVSAESYIR